MPVKEGPQNAGSVVVDAEDMDVVATELYRNVGIAIAASAAATAATAASAAAAAALKTAPRCTDEVPPPLVKWEVALPPPPSLLLDLANRDNGGCSADTLRTAVETVAGGGLVVLR